MSVINPEPSGWYWLYNRIYIISDFPGAEERIKAHPDIEALPLAELEARAHAARGDMDDKTT